jgi:hypothetical protein
VAAPSVTFSSSRVAIGSPVEITYRFQVAPSAPPFEEDYLVFVHFLDTDGELLWTDDHQPQTPTRQWKAGQVIDYQRTMFIPKFPYVGDTRVELGLVSAKTGERLALAGETRGQRSYEVAAIELHLEPEGVFLVYGDGWHEAESGDGAGQEWQWTRKDAKLSFRNPKRDVRFYLRADQPVLGMLDGAQQVEIRVGDAIVDRFTMDEGADAVQKVDITAAQLGSGDTVDLTISVDKTFVPANVGALKSSDPRELGIRVFRTFIQPI